jgi:hypothetical protein
MPSKIIYPPVSKDRGKLYWAKPINLWNARQKTFRVDNSTTQRQYWRKQRPNLTLTKSINDLLEVKNKNSNTNFRFLILGDTGEGDQSQYSLNPLIKALNADFMIINGDLAYPAGRLDFKNVNDSDFHKGFFEPYRNLGIPVWATPGNHEYYSSGEGQEFFDLFCTDIHENLWHQYGLPFSKQSRQPFAYWEILDETNKLSIIGLDSGKEGNLDGTTAWYNFWTKDNPDTQQMNWLKDCLDRNEQKNIKTIVMFHIPVLVDSKKQDVNLKGLHNILSSYKCISTVICSHIHNMQIYTPQTWNKFVEDYTGNSLANPNCNYIVSGSGGAALAPTNFPQKEYKTSALFPNKEDWEKLERSTINFLTSLGLQKTWFKNVASDFLYDNDYGKHLSLLCIDKDNNGFRCTPYYINDIQNLYPDNSIVNIESNDPVLTNQDINKTKKSELSFSI